VLQVARSAADAAWWAAGATVTLAVLAVVTAILAVLAYKSQNKQLRNLETQATEQHAVNIRQIEVLGAQLAELQEAPKIREREAEERRLAPGPRSSGTTACRGTAVGGAAAGPAVQFHRDLLLLDDRTASLRAVA